MATFTVGELKETLEKIEDNDLPVLYLTGTNAIADSLGILQVLVIKDPSDKTIDRCVLSEESILY